MTWNLLCIIAEIVLSTFLCKVFKVNMHLKRWITSLVALPLLIFLILKGGAFLFAVFICFICMVSLSEYYKIVLSNTDFKVFGFIPFLSFITGFLIILAFYFKKFDAVIIILYTNFITAGIYSLFLFKHNHRVSDLLLKQIQGVFYIPVLFGFFVLIRNSSDGVVWICFLMALIFSGDTGAFYGGRFFGEKKLCPWISPGKTVAGAAGGIISNIIITLVFYRFFFSDYNLINLLIMSVLSGALGQAGDLFESVLKRVANIKDSGTILPGHGGILDRIDALIFAVPVIYIFKEYIL